MSGRKKVVEKITCPCCGAEYLPCEIFLPNSFLGKTYDIDKEYVSGKILSFSGNSMDTKETFVCDRCSAPFEVSTKILFYTKELEDINFNKPYKTSLKKNNLFLNED